MGCAGGQEILVVAAVIAIVFGASRLPQIGSGLGGALRNFKKGLSEDPGEIESEAGDHKSDEDP